MCSATSADLPWRAERRVERLRLLERAREAVEDDAVLGVRLLDALLEHADRHLVGHQLAAVHVRLRRLPSSVPCATASRNMSPVETCAGPSRSAMSFACVPLPVPGGPSRIRYTADGFHSFGQLVSAG